MESATKFGVRILPKIFQQLPYLPNCQSICHEAWGPLSVRGQNERLSSFWGALKPIEKDSLHLESLYSKLHFG